MAKEHKEECLLYMVATKDAESIIVDWLIESDLVNGFTSVPVSGHGTDNMALSVAEQVEGRRWQVLYLVRLPQINLDPVVQALKEDLPHISIEYWVVPVISHGKIT